LVGSEKWGTLQKIGGKKGARTPFKNNQHLIQEQSKISPLFLKINAKQPTSEYIAQDLGFQH
jgi:hypothetical protein